MVYGKKMTVAWHLDHLKVLRVDPIRVTNFTKWAISKYGDCAITQGKIHEYLGMTLDYSRPGMVRVSMIPYIEKLLKQFPGDLCQPAPSLAADHLFKVRDGEEATFLPEKQAFLFHHVVAQLLFVTTRAQRDIQMGVFPHNLS